MDNLQVLYEGLALQVDDLAARLHKLTMQVNKEPYMATMLTSDELQRDYPKKGTQARTVNLMVDVSESALRRVRAGFNPDQLQDVGQLHVLAAAMITFLEKLRDRPKPLVPDRDMPQDVPVSSLHDAMEEAARHAAIAITHFETGSMYAVKAATAEVYAAKNARQA